ncbi:MULTISPECIES: non-hydrolyzing UDP-N-acetylglucosamine 2-epimerase [Halomicrobium]|uniref:UDP-N-acetylglucosamine 2-epimerase n=2 Tax=Halomicrobium mukohataei TaxID=57705 RepID=C7NW85_HALMD|nr:MULTISPECIES: UDP-N-acetylglucosamine 2-epimerase (non-hydrolyzing) [Halomicrobium]ACV46226.1 UDP-N-acetylglucosamine 2-epimerase [Halomicrobium mukohataei DSM 12286]QCD64789.1 UDP-N-acetylglucosamine 2-epimerase (non-hydrolyzing) [Halomicrobium mukohataei]QFR19596.1 UDP-N-acetylglucosamine 2-epimerase (non-hydrolyzing) [Halomicrobium sp. ZPS1]
MTEQQPHIVIVLGTRPEIIKLAPVIRACEHQKLSYSVIHTGQHYSDSLDTVFFDQLELPAPDYQLGVGSNTHGQQTAEMLAGLEEILLEETPEVVLVQGDTNSVLAGAMAASKLEMQLGHVEAGLRSFDREMPEETNRVLADHAADYLFAPTETSRDHLREEGIADDRIHVTGNTVVDAVQQNQELAATKSTILEELDIAEKNFGLVTAHRAENVDERDRFAGLLEGVQRVGEVFDLEMIYPIHPRAKERLDVFDFETPSAVRLVEPQDYLDFIRLQKSAKIVLTDSGGVQEETCILGVPCVTLRENTERPETVEFGANQLAGVDPQRILTSTREMLEKESTWDNPFGDGQAADHILEILSPVGRGIQS